MPDGTVKCIESEIPFEVPEGWAWCRFGSIFYSFITGPFGTALHQSDYTSQGIPVVNPISIISGSIVKNHKMLVASSTAQRLCGFAIKAGDIVIGRRGEMGRCAVANETQEGWLCGTGSFTIRLFKPINPFFFSALLSSEYAVSHLTEQSIGSTMCNLNQAILCDLIVPIPPITQQALAMSEIGHINSIINAIEKEKADLQSIITQAKSKILDLAIRGKLVPQDPNDESAAVLLERIREEKESLIKQGKLKREKNESFIFRGDDKSYYEQSGAYQTNIDNLLTFSIPQSWVWCKLSSAWNLLSGRDLSPTEYNDFQNGIPYITGASNFESGNLLINRWTSNPKVISKAGDLLITCKGTVGEVLINDIGDIHIARQIMAFRNDRELFTPFFKYTILCFLENIRESAHGVIPGISREDLLNIYLPIPPIAEQRRIVVAIETAFEQLDTIMNSLA